jgi:hypothetical protein
LPPSAIRYGRTCNGTSRTGPEKRWGCCQAGYRLPSMLLMQVYHFATWQEAQQEPTIRAAGACMHMTCQPYLIQHRFYIGLGQLQQVSCCRAHDACTMNWML